MKKEIRYPYTTKTLGKVLKDIRRLKLDSKEIFITGSLALCIYGLSDTFHDVDLIAVDDLDNTEETAPKYNPEKASDIQWYADLDTEEITYSFTYVQTKNFMFNLLDDRFVNYKHKHIKLSKGIYLSSIEEILKAKAFLNRSKDTKNLMNVKRVIKAWCKIKK